VQGVVVYTHNYKTEKETKTKQSKQRKVNKKEVSDIPSLFLFFIVLLISLSLALQKDSPKAVRKSSYRHPSILSLSLTIFFLLIIQINSFFFSLEKDIAIVLSSCLFFLSLSFFSIVFFLFNCLCKLIGNTNKKPAYPHQTITTRKLDPFWAVNWIVQR